MPRSFLVKNVKRPVQSSVAKKVERIKAGFQPGDMLSQKQFVSSSRSAFVAVSESCKLEAKQFMDMKDNFADKRFSPGFHNGFPFTSGSFPVSVQFNPAYNGFHLPTSKPVSVLYSDAVISRETLPKDTEKENLQRKSPERIQVSSSVKGPLPQSTFICQLCKKTYQDAFSLAQHKCSGIKHIEHRCPECNKVFSCPANLASHRRWHRPRSPTTNKPTKTPLKDSKAEKSERANMTSTETISVVLENTELKTDQTVMEQKNVPERPNEHYLEEPESTNELDSNNNDIADITIDSNDKNGPYACSQCGKTFRRQAYLRKHLNYHSDRRPYPCQYCGKVFRSLTNRAKHVLNHAVGPRTHTCNVCGNGFPSRASLDKHGRIHSGEIFSCPKCATTFYSSPGLQRHIMKTHKSLHNMSPTSSL